MELHFKDRHSAELFNQDMNADLKKTEEEKYFIDEMMNDNEVEVSSSLDLNYLENLAKKDSINTNKKVEKDKADNKEKLDLKVITTSQLNRIESKQNAILEILECMPTPTVEKVEFKDSGTNDEETLKLNLELFNSRLIILSTKAENKYIENLLTTLEEISEHLSSNSFNIFSRDKSPVKASLDQIAMVGMGDSKLNFHLAKTEELLKEIDSFSNMQVFEQSYSFASLLLDKGMLLNAITLLNEATSMYMIESIKTYSKEIAKYTYLVGEEDTSKLYSRAKDFFDNLFFDKSKDPVVTALFPHHRIVKDIDKEIARKLRNIQKTWANKGDGGLFKKYAYIIKRIRYIRNSVAHADMETSFRSVKDELKSLNDDFYYLAIKKNILKK